MSFSDNPETDPAEQEIAAKLALWREEALGDEEHIAHTVGLLQKALSEPGHIRDLVLSGTITVEFVATVASLVVSMEMTDRNFGASPAVGSEVLKLLPSNILD